MEQEIFNFDNYVDIISRRRNIIIAFFVVVVLVVAFCTFIMTPIYRATTTILIDIENPDVLTTTAGVGIGGRDSGSYLSYREYFKTQIGIITSRSIAREAIKEFNLMTLPEYQMAEDPISLFLGSVKVKPVAETRLVKLNVDNKNPELAAKISNRMAELYIMHNLAYISKSERLNLLKNEYLRLETKLSGYSKKYKHGHPEMIKVKKEMAEIVEYIDEEKNPDPLSSEEKEITTQEKYKHTLGDLKANNISIVDYAETPTSPVKPKKTLNLFLAIIIGLFGGTGLGFFFEYQDATVKDVEDLDKLIKWPFLGSVPFTPGEEKEFYAQRESLSFITEAYRTISTRIFFSDTKERPLKSIAISSLGPQEGKTTSICNLGIVMAQNKKRVLLVDADMHKPRLNKVFKRKNAKGLSSFLNGEAEYDEVLQETEIENLYLVADRRSSHNPSILLASDKMREFYSIVEEKFDYVLFDTPPIGAITDATILSQIVDGLILVIESGKTPKRALVRNNKFLMHSKIRCAGVVLVKSPVNGSEAYYYHHYHQPS